MWVDEDFSVPPPEGTLGVRSVKDATLTPYGDGVLGVLPKTQPSRYVTGAVYDGSGALVRPSQRLGGLFNDHALSADPETLPAVASEGSSLTGTWLYGGTWFNHFGHFLTETLTTLWPEHRFDGLIYHPFWFGRKVQPWQRQFLALAGHHGEPHVVGDEAVRVERLLVPTRSFTANGYARPEAVGVWRGIAEALPARDRAGSAKVFFSRSSYHAAQAAAGRSARRRVPNEVALDAMMAERGYRVVQSEDLPLPEQIRLGAETSVLSGVSGSALHLSVFARPGTQVLEIGDNRAGRLPVRTQQILARACGHRLGFVPFTSAPDGYDLAAIARELDELDV
jgi:capsular polysaccharide biosynthesis protein